MMSTPFKTLVFGPAYVDRVVRLDQPLLDPTLGKVLDHSVMGRWIEQTDSRMLTIEGLATGTIQIDCPLDWPGPSGRIGIGNDFEMNQTVPGSVRQITCRDWQEDLGGMGAGYAAALGGKLVLVLGDESDPINTQVRNRLKSANIDHHAITIPGRVGEWTLLLSSAEHGDKLGIGFRDHQAREIDFTPFHDEPCDLLVAASMTNQRAANALNGSNAKIKLFAPAMRNMLDHSPRILSFIKCVDVLTCNKAEWHNLDDREEIAFRVSILIVTDGPNGAEIRYTTPDGDAGRLVIPVFPRSCPPVDTNRAGEAFASTFIKTLMSNDWQGSTVAPEAIEVAALRASAAAALVLDRADFGFASDQEIDQAIGRGIV
jgi:ribokinase